MEVVPQEDQQAWAVRTQADISSAKLLTREASSQVIKNASVVLDKRYAQSVQSQLKFKMADTTTLTDELKDQIRKVDGMLRKLNESSKQLQSEHAKKWGPLCVVSRRLEIRERRPAEERSNDQFQIDLDLEKEALVDARQQLLDSIESTKERIRPLEGMKQELQEDVIEKRRSYHIDHLCLLDAGHRGVLSVGDVVEAPKLAEALNISPPSPRGAVPGTGNSNDEVWKMRTKALISRADRMVQECEQHVKSNSDTAATVDKMCKRAEARTVSSMNKSVADLTSQKKSLESELLEVEKMLSAAGTSFEKTSRRMKQHEAPMQTLRRQFLLRQQRTERENIRDPAHDGLENHLNAMKSTVQTLSSEADGTLNLVEELKAAKQRLTGALQLKTAALRLDMACSKVTLKSVAAYFMAATQTSAARAPSPTTGSDPRYARASSPDGARRGPSRAAPRGARRGANRSKSPPVSPPVTYADNAAPLSARSDPGSRRGEFFGLWPR